MGRGLRKRRLAFLQLHERNPPGETAGIFFAPPLCAFSALQDGRFIMGKGDVDGIDTPAKVSVGKDRLSRAFCR